MKEGRRSRVSQAILVQSDDKKDEKKPELITDRGRTKKTRV
jgi:hypothetical protein